MPTRTFDTLDLIKWGVRVWDDCEYVEEVTHICMEEFEEILELIIKAPDDGKLWAITIENNGGAGWNSITGTSYSYSDNPKPEEDSFEGVQVEPKEVTKIIYEKVK